VDRLPPHAPEAEQGVLGCILLSPRECMAECRAKISEHGGEFYDLRHQEIWRSLAALYDKNEHIDNITLQQHLADRQMLEQVGGLAYLFQLQDGVPSAANLPYYLAIVQEKKILRGVIRVCTESIGRIYDNGASAADLLAGFESEALGLRRNLSHQDSAVDLRSAIISLSDQYDAAAMGLKPDTIKTGFYDFDTVTHGLRPQQFIIVAAGPSVGKSAFVGNWLERVAVMDGIPCGLFSLEMPHDEIIHRMICSQARVSGDKLREGICDDAERTRVQQAAVKILRAPLKICDRGGLNVKQVAAIARQWKQQFDIQLLVVDYLQLMRSGEKTRGLIEEVTLISSALKTLAKQLNIPVVAVSAINREAEKEDRRPRMSDLRQSGTLEYDGDLIAFLHRPKDDDPGPGKKVELIISKQKGGRRGGIYPLVFFEDQTRFETASKIET